MVLLINCIIKYLRPPSPSYNYRARNVRRWARELLAADAKVLNVGSGAKRLVPGIINLDLYSDLQIDIIGDASRLPIKTASIDAVICSAVLEHVHDPYKLINEATRCLKKGGMIYIEVPFLQPLHMIEVGDYRRFSRVGLEALFPEYNILESGICIGPFSVLAWYSRKFMTIFSHSRYLNYFFEFISGWLTFWIKYLDIFIVKAKNLDIINGGVYLLGQKK